MRGWSKDKGEVFYHLAGVEEVIPLVRLVETYGPCIVPVMPEGEGTQIPRTDPVSQPDLWLRHVSQNGHEVRAAGGAPRRSRRGRVIPQGRGVGVNHG